MSTYPITYPVTRAATYAPSRALLGRAAGSVLVIPDTNASPANKYASGQYLAIQSINDLVSARSQSMSIQTGSFPNNTTFNATWPIGADATVKSWNAIDYGDYLQTVTPSGVRAMRIADITSMVSTHNFTYSDTNSGQGANVAIDGFFYRTQDSFVANMLGEWQVYFHVPTTTKTFIDAQPAVGSYVSAIIGSTPSITWTVTRQASNTQGVPYYLAYPADGIDKTNIQFDMLAFWNWLKGLGYLTGYEYVNGVAMGMEPLRATSQLVINSWSVSPYTSTILQDNVVTPWQTNLIPSQSFASVWDLDNATGLATGFRETAATGPHRAYLQTNPITASALKQYTFSVDLDVSSAQPIVQLQIFRQDYGASAQAYFDVANLIIYQSDASTFTSIVPTIRQLTNGKYRLTLTFTTDASTTALKPFIASAIYDATAKFYNISYTGNVSKTLTITNIYLYDPAELSPWFDWEARKTVYQGITATTVGAFADNDSVGLLVDPTINAYSVAAVAADTTRPTLQGTATKPYLLFDGTNDLLRAGTPPGGAAGMGNKNVASTLATVVRSNANGVNTVVFGFTNVGGTVNLWLFQSNTATATTSTFRIVDSAGNNILSANTINAPNVFDGTDHVVIVTDSGTTITIFVDGVQAATQAYIPNGSLTINQVSLGALRRNTISSWWAGRIYATKGFPGVLSGADIARLNTYMAALK